MPPLKSKVKVPAKQPSAPNPVSDAGTSLIITSQRTDKIFGALSKAQGEVEKSIRSKNGVDDTTNKEWRYAGLDDVLDAVKDARSKNGLGIVERFPAGKAALQAILVHESGQWIDYGTYAFGDYKTQNEKSEIITRARRHFMKCIFGVVDQADDKDGASANNRPITGENIDEPLADDAGGRALTDKERREAYDAAKDEYRITPEITKDGRINFDSFAVEYEAALGKVKSMNDLSMLSKANHKTLSVMSEERPEVFAHIQDVTSPIAQKFL